MLLAEEIRRLSATPKEDAQELFRRMCFNALISNTDDHPRNHAVIAPGTAWRLSPAYDLTPSMPISAEAERMVAALETQVRNTWHETARRAGVSEADCKTIASAFAYPGFSLKLPV